MDDERLKQAGGGDYFEELLPAHPGNPAFGAQFLSGVCDIYATSVDYDPASR